MGDEGAVSPAKPPAGPPPGPAAVNTPAQPGGPPRMAGDPPSLPHGGVTLSTYSGAPPGPTRVVLVDGGCVLCSRTVRFIRRRDGTGGFRFLSLGSPQARALLARSPIPADAESVILYDNGRVYLRSEAVFRILAHLRWPWRLLTAFRVLPRWLTDPAYRLVARYRYRLFGRSDVCLIAEDVVCEAPVASDLNPMPEGERQGEVDPPRSGAGTSGVRAATSDLRTGTSGLDAAATPAGRPGDRPLPDAPARDGGSH